MDYSKLLILKHDTDGKRIRDGAGKLLKQEYDLSECLMSMADLEEMREDVDQSFRRDPDGTVKDPFGNAQSAGRIIVRKVTDVYPDLTPKQILDSIPYADLWSYASYVINGPAKKGTETPPTEKQLTSSAHLDGAGSRLSVSLGTNT